MPGHIHTSAALLHDHERVILLIVKMATKDAVCLSRKSVQKQLADVRISLLNIIMATMKDGAKLKVGVPFEPRHVARATLVSWEETRSRSLVASHVRPPTLALLRSLPLSLHSHLHQLAVAWPRIRARRRRHYCSVLLLRVTHSAYALLLNGVLAHMSLHLHLQSVGCMFTGYFSTPMT